MENIDILVTEEDLINAGAIEIEPGINIYEIESQKYIVKNGKIIHTYIFEDKAKIYNKKLNN